MDNDWADEDDISEIEEMLLVIEMFKEIEAGKPPAQPEDLGILSELGYKLRYGK